MNYKTIIFIVITAFLIVTAVTILHHNFPALFGSRTFVTKFTDSSDGSLQSYLNLAQSLNPRGSVATTSATFLAAGDIMLSRNVAAAIQKNNDVGLPFRNIADILKSTDFNFANLESPVAPSAKNQIIGGHSLLFGAPAGYIKGLADFNFKILNLANNHALDQGLLGIKATRSALDNLNIQYEGAGDNLDQAWRPAIVEANGIKIGFIGASYASVNDNGKTTNNYVARIGDLENLKSSIQNLKSKSDFIVVTMHAGTEYAKTPNTAQTAFAHAAVDDGADMVIGSHPHWVQTIEEYNGKYIFYSLGNFIFDQAWSQETKEGLTLKITLTKSGSANLQAPGAASLGDLQGSRIPAKLESVELIPIIINSSQPRPATADEGKKVLKKINQNMNILYP
jgi:poly-gamma-glutamate synthesis protein (capsule biosynthesis protein)